ncbi:hypothetical protein B4168_0286 [Anoxybacillus flavithermus]|nr:hypothetical protein B4168_0286 [Anoxybacillus flavithermus]OAO88801.1 hypothetical protein GT23_0041 [Parageobacillus thermoglucosidasius]
MYSKYMDKVDAKDRFSDLLRHFIHPDDERLSIYGEIL